MTYDFLIETYETERVKVLSVWSEFRDDDLPVRPGHLRLGDQRPNMPGTVVPSTIDTRGRSVHEQLVHQCMSEDLWFRTMLGIDVGASPLPEAESRLAFIQRYAEDSGKRLAALHEKDASWWEADVKFFDTSRSRAWVMVRRLTHTSHHRGQLTAMLRMLGRDLHSTYGPTADTGGLAQNGGRTIYAYADLQSLLDGETRGGSKSTLPGGGNRPVTERPG